MSVARENEKRLELRLPSDLHAEMTRAAVEDERSINKEIVVFLRQGLAARKQKNPDGASSEAPAED